jgi:DNA-binding NarL/FixJ family response regulator
MAPALLSSSPPQPAVIAFEDSSRTSGIYALVPAPTPLPRAEWRPSRQALFEGRMVVVEGPRVDLTCQAILRPRRPQDPVLSPVELRVAEALTRACSLKELAFQSGLAASTLSNHAIAAVQKLGLRRRESLVWVTEALARGTTIPFASEHFEAPRAGLRLVLDGGLIARFSPAERMVALRLVDGLSYAAIAAERGVSVRTVANQIARILRKADARCRLELVRRLASAGSAS